VATLRALSLVEVLPGERVRLPAPVRARAARALPGDARERYGTDALGYYRALVDAIGSPLQPAGISRLAQELPNLHYWLEWGYKHEPAAKECVAARLTTSLRNFYMLVNWPPEAVENFRRALEAARRAGDRLGEANTRKAIGDVQRFRDEYDRALESYAAALQLFRAVGDRLGEANTVLSMAGMETDPEAGRDRFEQAVALYRAIGDVYSVARGLYYYALYLRDHGQDADAIPLLEQSAAMFEERGLPEIAATARAAIPS
jgi:tetratricopeptide (TPR) repeat protein